MLYLLSLEEVQGRQAKDGDDPEERHQHASRPPTRRTGAAGRGGNPTRGLRFVLRERILHRRGVNKVVAKEGNANIYAMHTSPNKTNQCVHTIYAGENLYVVWVHSSCSTRTTHLSAPQEHPRVAWSPLTFVAVAALSSEQTVPRGLALMVR